MKKQTTTKTITRPANPLEDRNDFADLLQFVMAAKDKATFEDRRLVRKGLAKWKDYLQISGHLAEQARNQLIKLACSASDPITQEFMKAEADIMLASFGLETASPLEKVIIEQIVNCWIYHSINEYKYASIMTEGSSLNQAEFWERRITASQKRYLRAVETWARIRRLGLPQPAPVQVNIAEKQVNVNANNVQGAGNRTA